MVLRKEYLSQLTAWREEQVIKVITGVRRCGKSTLLKQYQDQLLQQGVSQDQIITINFEELEYEHLLDYQALYQYIKERLCPNRMTYIFLDEIQKVDSFEKVVDSLYVKDYRYTVDFIEQTTGLTGVGAYLTMLLELDSFFLNEDRHTNNLAVIRNEKHCGYYSQKFSWECGTCGKSGFVFIIAE